MNYIIWAPEFTHRSAGIRCLYTLCDELNRKGLPAFITGSLSTNTQLKAPLIDQAKACRLLQRDDYAVVYPEVVTGNPYQAKNVIRWVLNKPGFLGGLPVFAKSERVFYYSEVFKDYIQNTICGKLYLPTLEESLFSPGTSNYQERSLVSFYIGKSLYREGFVDLDQAIEITRLTPHRENLPALFRACQVLYCFDNSTALIYEAVLCGCPVVVIPDGSQNRNDYSKLELGCLGIAWGPSEIDLARASVAYFPEHYAKVKSDSSILISEFIEKTQAWPAIDSAQKLDEIAQLALNKISNYYNSNIYEIANTLAVKAPGLARLLLYLTGKKVAPPVAPPRHPL